MSTSFYTLPKIPYEEFLKCEEFKCSIPKERVYIPEIDHVLIETEGYEGDLFAFKNEDGSVSFERFGIQNPNILNKVIEIFNVKVFDYCDLEWPEDSSG